MSLSQLRLKECLKYEPDTGNFYWIISKQGISIGQKAGYTKKTGYNRIRVDGKIYQTSHLAFLYMTGSFPPNGYEVDHIDRNPSNDSWTNIRITNRSQNCWNKGPNPYNTSGVKGVRKIHNGRWKTTIVVYGKSIHLGYFDTLDEAAIIRREAELKYYGKYAP